MARTNKDIIQTKLVTIADAIRAKNGSTAEMSLDQMAEAVEGLSIVSSEDQTFLEIFKSWNTDAVWDTIKKHGDSVRKNPDTFKIFIGMTTSYNHSTYGSQLVRVTDVAHFDRSNGTGKAAFCFDHTAIPVIRKMNNLNTNSGGYPASAMKTFLEDTFYNGMPASVRNAITPVTIQCSLTAGSSVTPSNLSNCKVFLPSEMEVFGTHTYDNGGTQLAWYSANNTRVKLYDNSANGWWLRSPIDSNYFALVHSEGTFNSYLAGYDYGVSPSFNIG